MDTPILALTRRRRDELRAHASELAVGENMRLLVQLRWIAVAGQLLTILVVNLGLGVPLPLVPMLAVVGMQAAANFVARLLLTGPGVRPSTLFMALLFDVTALALQLYLSGGAANPFIALFFLQVVLGAILLDLVWVCFLTGVAVTAYALLAVFSLPLIYPPSLAEAAPRLQMAGQLISFALTGGLLAVFISRIIRNLRSREAHVADLRQHAAEEDGIVRMGLLASGAAHELGTPLSTLSVILNDWSRMPRLAGDAELAGELAEMQHEVGRCKAIVSDILHSAGTPRGDDRTLVAADAFLDEIAVAWRPSHPSTPLDYRPEGLAEARLATEPAMRQTIASLLDNAAEVSPGGVILSASVTEEGLDISVLDDGPGFSEAQLAAVGKPYQSSKGAGRGLGLFLATSLARRLGGRLVVANRDGGGADVRLILPLASGAGTM